MKLAQTLASLAGLLTLLLPLPVLAAGDFYIRSLHTNGSFTGSHEILTLPEQGYHEAEYCDRKFWVTSTTVIWTEEEVAAGRVLVLEEQIGDTRQVVCADSKAFATLEDLGLKKKEIVQIRQRNQPTDMKSSRLRTIRDAFKQFK